MRFITVRDLRLKTGEIWRRLQEEGEFVVTSSGKPGAVLSGVEEKSLEDYLKALRRARATRIYCPVAGESPGRARMTPAPGPPAATG